MKIRNPSPGEAGANPALSRNREPAKQGQSEHLAGTAGSNTPSVEDGGARAGTRAQPDPPSPVGLNEGHLVNTSSTIRSINPALVAPRPADPSPLDRGPGEPSTGDRNLVDDRAPLTAGSPGASLAGKLASFLAATSLALLAVVLLANPAQAAAYRYWSYWQGATGVWVMASTGPGDYKVVDRDVQGWRFEISTEAGGPVPDNAPNFDTLCPGMDPTTDGSLRVAVVIDAGFVADSPTAEQPPADSVKCVTVPAGSTGNQALAAAASVREQGGLVCAINDYPAAECGASVNDADAQAAAAAAKTEEPNPADPTASAVSGVEQSAAAVPSGLLVGGAALIALGAAVVIAMRRRPTREG